MNDLSKLKEILESRREKGMRLKGWDQFDYKIKETKENVLLVIGVPEVGFCFTLEGNLVGIYNLKE